MMDVWYNHISEPITFENMIDEIRNYVSFNRDFEFELIVGTDSQIHRGIKSTKYVTAVVIRRVGNGAKYFYRKEYKNDIPALRKKIWTEALLTYDVLEKVKLKVNDIVDNKHIISHVDVGVNGKTKDYIKEITSIFTNSGYDVKIKPNSYVASGVADKHSK